MIGRPASAPTLAAAINSLPVATDRARHAGGAQRMDLSTGNELGEG